MATATFIGILALIVPVIYYRDGGIGEKYVITKIDGCKVVHSPIQRSFSSPISLQQTINEMASPFFDITRLQSDLGINTDVLLENFVSNMCTNEITFKGSLKTNLTQFGSDVSLTTTWELNLSRGKLADLGSASVDIKNEFKINGQNIEISVRKEKNSLEFKSEIKSNKLGMALYAKVISSQSSGSVNEGSSKVDVEIRNPQLVYGNLEDGRITVGKEGIIFTRDVVLDSTSDNKKIFHVYGRASTNGLDVGLGIKIGDGSEAKLLMKIERDIAIGFAVAKNVEIFGSTFKMKAKFEAKLRSGKVKLSIGMDGMLHNPLGLKNFAFGNALFSAGYIHGLPTLEAGFQARFGDIKIQFYFGLSLAKWTNNYVYISTNSLDVQSICGGFGIDISAMPKFIKTAGFKDGITIAISSSSTGIYIHQIGKSIEPGLSVNGKPLFSLQFGINYLKDFSKKYIYKRYIQ